MKGQFLSTGDVIRVRVERLAFGGEGVARHEGLVVFVPLAAPGDILDVKVIEVKKNFARGSILGIVEPSSERCQPPCRYYGVCGGCQLQHIRYDAQLVAKAAFIQDSLRKIGGIEWSSSIEVKCGPQLGYRSRAQLKLSRSAASRGVPWSTDADHKRQGNTILVGFHRRGSHVVCDVEECCVLEPELNQALTALRAGFNMPDSGEMKIPGTIDLASGDSGVAVQPPLRGLFDGPVTRRVGLFSYRFSASTFFQANPSLLPELVESATTGGTGRLAVDLYAGAGLFTLPLARRFDRVIGVEANPETAAFAAANIAGNGLTNVEFCRDRTEDWLREHADAVEAGQHQAADLMLLDPPRGGVEGAGKHLVRAAPLRISYVSCNPATLGRDLAMLIKHGYRLESVLGFDLFPQTYHVETVALLSRRQG